MKLEQYKGACGCGKTHELDTKLVLVERGATEKLPELIRQLALPKRCVVVCDHNTSVFATAVAERVGLLLHPLKGIIVLAPDGLHADEHAVAKVETQLHVDAGWLIAVGAGTIHDATRYVACKRDIPFLSYPTAASVDGFVSTVCAMTWYGYKKTMPGVAPIAVVADTDVFMTAPCRLTASGVGDVLGKYTALTDWRVTSLLGLEDYCPAIAGITREAVDKVRAAMPGIKAGEPAAMEQLMTALLLSGIAMQLWGNSRPASGAEHHLSHLWEMEALNGTLDALHGEKVGVGLCVLLPLYKDMAADWAPAYRESEIPFPLLEERFDTLYEGLVEENTPDPLARLTPVGLRESAGAVREALAALPDAAALRDEMTACGCPTTMTQIGLEEALLADSLLLSPFVRGRISFLRLLNCLSGYEASTK